MIDHDRGPTRESAAGAIDVGEYCRRVEDYLTRVNGGHLVRVVGAGFELVRGWADEGVPLSVVFRGIDLKAERHRAGASKRPLRIEFCEADVRDTFQAWRRAVGVPVGDDTQAGSGEDAHGPPRSRRRSLSKHLDRVVDRLAHVIGRTDLPARFRNVLDSCLGELTAIREEVRQAHGRAAEGIGARLGTIDRGLLTEAREAVTPEILQDLQRQAEEDLAPFRGRLSTEAWSQAVDVTMTRLLRTHFDLPVIEFDASR